MREDKTSAVISILEKMDIKQFPDIETTVRICKEANITYGTFESIWSSHNLAARFGYTPKKKIRRCIICGVELPHNCSHAKRYCDFCLSERRNAQRRTKYKNKHENKQKQA